jgi:hypothetical protein
VDIFKQRQDSEGSSRECKLNWEAMDQNSESWKNQPNWEAMDQHSESIKESWIQLKLSTLELYKEESLDCSKLQFKEVYIQKEHKKCIKWDAYFIF